MSVIKRCLFSLGIANKLRVEFAYILPIIYIAKRVFTIVKITLSDRIEKFSKEAV